MKKILFVFLLFSIVNVIVSAEKYAVLITGDYAAKNVPSALRWDTYQEADPTKPGPMECFWNDTYLVWEMLINMGYDNDKIFVLFANGTDYWKVAADAGTPIAERYTPQHIFPDSTDFQITKNYLTNGAATKDNIGLIAQELKDEMHDDDFLFVWTFDHGGFEGLDEMDSLLYPPEGPEVPSYLVLLDPTGLSYDSIYDYEFAQLFNPLLANKKVYWMEQCFSGGFEYEMTHDVCDSTVSYGEHPQLNNVYFISSSQYNMPSYQADNVLAYYENGIEKAETSCYNFYENEYISSKSYLHGEFDFHMLSATKGKKPDNSTEYYDLTIKGVRYNPKYSEVDGYNRLPEYKTNADGVVTVEEAVLWCTDYETNTLGIPEFYPDGTLIDPSPVCSDYENIGHHTSLKYPTIIYDDFYTVGSYLFQPLKGEIAVVEDITIRNGSLSLADNSETVILNSKNIDLKAQLYLQ
ncbi:MAG: hypothetical protein KKD38_07665, partial [Candidatus Delongbacteria bacterium]|nr:hypothetical protein [Candidatus Delongbacteria bacterium]